MSSDGYTLKERIEELARTIAGQLGAIVAQLDSIERKLDDKASRTWVEGIEARMKAAEKDIIDLRVAAGGSAAVSKYSKWLNALVIAGVFGLIGTLVYVVATVGGHP